jgi:hypothetical protein
MLCKSWTETGPVRKGADRSLTFPISSTTKRIFLGWVKEVITWVWSSGGNMFGKYIVFSPVTCFLHKAKDLPALLNVHWITDIHMARKVRDKFTTLDSKGVKW